MPLVDSQQKDKFQKFINKQKQSALDEFEKSLRQKMKNADSAPGGFSDFLSGIINNLQLNITELQISYVY